MKFTQLLLVTLAHIVLAQTQEEAKCRQETDETIREFTNQVNDPKSHDMSLKC